MALSCGSRTGAWRPVVAGWEHGIVLWQEDGSMASCGSRTGAWRWKRIEERDALHGLHPGPVFHLHPVHPPPLRSLCNSNLTHRYDSHPPQLVVIRLNWGAEQLHGEEKTTATKYPLKEIGRNGIYLIGYPVIYFMLGSPLS